jgi:transglutaminase-like putative cysteine protease
LNDLRENTGAAVSLSYRVEVYAVETGIIASQIRPVRQESARTPPASARPPASTLASVYTSPSPLIPSGDEEVKRRAAAIAGREQNPYIKAQRIYEWLIREGGIRWESFTGGAREALIEKHADPYMAALLFCALARAAGVPAQPVSGVLVENIPGTVRHFWAEFWIDGAGWIPLDPAFGAGAAPASFSLREDHEKYYFGNLDNQRITFSRGQAVLSQVDPRGRIAVRDRDYALQTLWEEAVGGLRSYSSLWSDVTINGVYAE